MSLLKVLKQENDIWKLVCDFRVKLFLKVSTLKESDENLEKISSSIYK